MTASSFATVISARFADLRIQIFINQWQDESLFFKTQRQREEAFAYGSRSSLESFNRHPLFADSFQHCSSQSYGLCLHHRAEALCWIQSPSAPRLPAWVGLALSLRTVSLLHHSPPPTRHPPMKDCLLRSKRSANSNFCFHLFRSTQFVGWVLLLAAVCQFKDTFWMYYLSLWGIIMPRAEIACSLIPFSLPACKRENARRGRV